MNEAQQKALLRVAEAAAVLFRPPYRRQHAGYASTEEIRREMDDFRKLYDALNSEDCPVEIGEEFT